MNNWNYKKINKFKYSAGILPYTFDQTGGVLFLLGKDNESDWSDFGGRCEFRDQNDERYTASREFYEETLGAVMTIPEMLNKINTNCTKIVSKTLNGSPYYMYLVYIDYLNFSDSFNKTSNFIRYQHQNDTRMINKIIEKNTIRWVTMDTVINCIDNKGTGGISLRGVFYKTLDLCRDQLQMLNR